MKSPRRRPASGPTLAIHPLESGAPLPDGPFVATVPGADAPLLPLDLPSGLRGVARERVARRQLRDAGCGAGLDLRPARLGGGGGDAWARMLVCDGARRAAWAGQVAGAGKRCRAVLPDYLALPAAKGLWVIDACNAGAVRARLGLEDGFAAEPDLALALLQEAARAAPPAAILRLGAPCAPLDGWLVTLDVPVRDTPEALPAGIAPPVRFGHGELALDLARDPEALRAALRGTLRRIAAALVLALGGFGFWAASVQIETDRLRDQDLTYRRNAEEMLRAGLVPSGPVLDIRAQVEAALDRARAQAGDARDQARPLDVLRTAGKVLAAHDPRITRVSFQPGLGLVIDLEIGDFAALDALVGDLATAGTGARVAQSVAREGRGVEAVLALAVDRGGRGQ